MSKKLARLMALVMALVMVFALSACQTTPAKTDDATTSTDTKDTTTTDTKEPEKKDDEPEKKDDEPEPEPEFVSAVEPDDRLAADVYPDLFDADNYDLVSSDIYAENLGEFYQLYQAAKDPGLSQSQRWAQMAVAEGKLLGAAIMIPLQSRGGNYAISRIAPRTLNSTLFGSDNERYHSAIIVKGDFLKLDEVNEIRAKWGELRGTGTYSAWVIDYLTSKGYEINEEYNMNYSSDPNTWDTLATSMEADTEKIIQTYDGLYEYDNENMQRPALATSYEVSDDGLTYTFHIREGVIWTDSQGRKVADVKADDWVAGMQHMMDAMGGLEYLVGPDGAGITGADAYIYGETDDFTTVGVKALDDYTLQYTLDQPCSFFMTMLGYSVFAPMSREYYTSQGGKFGAEYDAEDEGYLYGADPDLAGTFVVTDIQVAEPGGTPVVRSMIQADWDEIIVAPEPSGVSIRWTT